GGGGEGAGGGAWAGAGSRGGGGRAPPAPGVVRRPDQGAGRDEGASERASQLSRAATPPGPSTTRSASAASALTSPDALHTVTPGCPCPRSARTAAKAAISPRSSPANSTGPAF